MFTESDSVGPRLGRALLATCFVVRFLIGLSLAESRFRACFAARLAGTTRAGAAGWNCTGAGGCGETDAGGGAGAGATGCGAGGGETLVGAGGAG